MQIRHLHICMLNCVFVAKDLACSVNSSLQNLDSVLVAWAQSWCKLKLGMFWSLKAVMFAPSPLSFFLFFFLAATEIQSVMRQADFESFTRPFMFEKFPNKMARRGP